MRISYNCGKAKFECGRALLTPYYMNGTWKNDNPGYNPINAAFDICIKIESNKQALGNFLKEIFDRVRRIDDYR